jgi:probable HAF family extracellular repeat protein
MQGMKSMHCRTKLATALQMAVWAACVFGTLAATAAPPKYRMTLLTPRAWDDTWPVAINNAGHVMGTFDPPEFSGDHTFLYRNGTTIDIKPTGEFSVIGIAMNDADVIVGTVEMSSDPATFKFEDDVFTTLAIPELDRPSPTDINENGQIVGSGRDPESGNSRGFLYQNGGVEFLPDGPFSRGIEPVAINDLGSIIGSGSRDDARWAFLYQDGETIDIGALGRRSAAARAINNSGRVAGAVDAGYGGSETAVIRNTSGIMKKLGTLGGPESSAFDINGRGQVVGYAFTENWDDHAVLYRSGAVVDLGTLGRAHSHARDITDNGQVVGVASDDYTLATSRVFIYGVDGNRTRDLNDLIDPEDPLKPYVSLNWVPFRSAINEYGQVAALGLDSRKNRMRVFLVTPVDATAPVVAASVAGTAGKNGWYTTDVNVSWVVADPEAPIGARIGCGTDIVNVDSPGSEHTCQAKSMGGTSSVAMVTIKRDTGKPSVTVPRPQNGAVYGRNQVVSASYRCSDSMSGIQSCSGTIPSGDLIDTSRQVTNATFRVVAVDQAGLKSIVTRTYSVN